MNKRLIIMLIFFFLFSPVPVLGSDFPVVTLGEGGFEPASITVGLGTSVRFVTTRGRYFWPASDDHPAHAAYAEFDPKDPVGPADAWEFRFDRVGRWKFHDHISPYFTGEIIVDSTRSAQAAKEPAVNLFRRIRSYVSNFVFQKIPFFSYRTCREKGIERSRRIACWEKILVGMVQERGLKRSLAFVEAESARNTAFAADCHVYAHRIGEEYYWKFVGEKEIEVSDRFAICDLGFFHGFMQEFVSHGTTERAKRYCDAIWESRGRSQYPTVVEEQCYHGMGHGFAFLYAAYDWGNNEKIISRGIAHCERILPDNPRECVNGVYGGMAAMYWGLHGFRLKLPEGDAFAFCKDQPEAYKTGCYDQFVPVLFTETNLDLVKAGRVIEAISDESIARVAMAHAGGMPSYTKVPATEDYSDILEACKGFRAPLSEDCIKGFAAALIRIGTRSQATARAKDFCQKSPMSSKGRQACVQGMVEQMRYKYSEKDAADLCRSVGCAENLL